MGAAEGWDDDKDEEDLEKDEFSGLDSLIPEGPIDADTSKSLPPAESELVSDNSPEIYHIPVELASQVGSWDELLENAPHMKDVANSLRPDEIGDRKLNILSGMDKVIMYVTNKIQNAFIYTRLRTDSSRFQAEFVAIAVVAGKTYTATYLTPG